VAGRQQLPRDDRSDVAGTAGDKKLQLRPLNVRRVAQPISAGGITDLQSPAS
jgi:hypothetical protein